MTFNGRRHFLALPFLVKPALLPGWNRKLPIRIIIIDPTKYFFYHRDMIRIGLIIQLTLVVCSWSFLRAQQALYQIQVGSVYFISEAPLEVIEATSEELRGLIDTEKRTFAFAVKMRSFEGFNSPLQKEHFNENYMESHRYPEATFSGKIIGVVDFIQDGDYTIRAKGILNIHGVEQERIIKSNLKIENGKMTIKSDFTILLEEHDISIPRIVYQKIAEEIKVQVNAELTP